MWITPTIKTNTANITSATATPAMVDTSAAKHIRFKPRQIWVRTGFALLLTLSLILGAAFIPQSSAALAKATSKTTTAPKKKKAPAASTRATSTKKNRRMTSQELNFRIVLASYTWPDGAYGDQCKIWAQWVVAKAGGLLPAGYRNEEETRGFGVRKPVEEAVPGDIFQMDKPHTAIVIKNLGDGRLLVRDSNWVSPLKVGEHVLDTRNYNQYNPRVYTVIPK